jgi:hypothetical protein
MSKRCPVCGEWHEVRTKLFGLFPVIECPTLEGERRIVLQSGSSVGVIENVDDAP